MNSLVVLHASLLLIFTDPGACGWYQSTPTSAQQFNYVTVDSTGWPTWDELNRSTRPKHYLYRSTDDIPIYIASLFEPSALIGSIDSPIRVDEFLTNFVELYDMEYALRYINENTSLLPGFELRVVHRFTEVSDFSFF